MVQSAEPLDVARKYFEVLSAKDFATVAAMLADDIVWHQPGVNQFSGTRRGGEAVGGMLGGMMSVSQETFEISLIGPLAANGSLVAAPVHFSGTRHSETVNQDGIDLLRVEGERIAGARRPNRRRPSPCRPLGLGQHLNRPTTTPA